MSFSKTLFEMSGLMRLHGVYSGPLTTRVHQCIYIRPISIRICYIAESNRVAAMTFSFMQALLAPL
jgi:hypothetical protein